MHHYISCGLNNVWLKNGYVIKETPYGTSVAVANADELHKLLALELTSKIGRLTGTELRYLRSMLGLSQQGLAKMVGVSEQALSLWERTGKVPKSGDALVRIITVEKLEGDAKVSEVIERINTVERLVHQQIIASARQHKWRTKVQVDKPELDTA